jgi:hypothetical protein
MKVFLVNAKAHMSHYIAQSSPNGSGRFFVSYHNAFYNDKWFLLVQRHYQIATINTV